MTEQELADVERLNFAVDQSIVAPQISRRLSADQARQGPRLDARRGRRAARPEDRLRLCLVPPCRGPGRLDAGGSRSACSGSPAASSASARPTSAARRSSIMPRWSTSRPARWCGSTSSSAGSQVPGIKFGDLRTPQGAAQMVERLLGRMKPGDAVRRAQERRRADVHALPRAQPPLAAGRRRRGRGRAARPASPQARIRPQDMVPLVGPGFRPTDKDEQGLWKEMERVEEEIAGSNLLIKDPEAHRLSAGHHRHRRRPGGEGFPHLSRAHPRLQRDDVPDRLRGGLLGPAAADAQRGAARRRDRARIGPLPAPPHDPLVARPAAQDRHFRDRRDARRGRRRGRRRLSRRLCPARRSSAPSCRCSSTAARWRPRPTPWAPS